MRLHTATYDEFTATIEVGEFTTVVANVHRTPQGYWHVETPDGPIYSEPSRFAAEQRCRSLASRIEARIG